MNDLELFPHNQKTYEKVKKTLENEKIVGIVHATGTGKSYIALKLVLENPSKKVVYVVPTKGIIEHLQNIIKINGLANKFNNVEFRTYQSFINLSAEEMQKITPDLLILDEFHHLGAPVWGARINYLVNHNPHMQIFGMTAYTVRDRGTSYERDMANEDGNELFSNKIVSRYDLVDAMIDKLIPKPIYKTAYTNLLRMYNDLEQKLNNPKTKQADYELCEKILKDIKKRITEAPGLAEVMQKNIKPNGKYIYYCPPLMENGVNDIETIKKEAYEWFRKFVPEQDIFFYTTTSQMGNEGKINRDAFYHDQDLEGHDVAGKLRIMFAINQYNEGIHSPNIDGVILGRGTTSDIVYFEQIGRALSIRGDSIEKFRQYEIYSDKELQQMCEARDIKIKNNMTREDLIELLVAPIIIDLTNNYDFIKELENNLKNRIRERRQNKNYNQREIHLANANFDIEIANQDLYEMLRYVRDRLGFSWFDYYNLLVAYKEKYGTCEVAQNYITANGIKLGIWVSDQRRSYSKNKLSSEKVKLLDDIGFTFGATRKERWQKGFEELEKYYKKYGNANVPFQYITEDGYKLGIWAQAQRRRKNKLSSEKVKRLEEIGFDFGITRKERWQKGYEELEKYYKKYGNTNVPSQYITEDGYKLGKWAQNQRSLYNKNKLSSEKVKRLEETGFDFEVTRKEMWQKGYEELEKYYKKYGNCDVPQSYIIDSSISLGSWVNTQRRFYKLGKLSQERIDLLDQLGFRFERIQDWYNNFEKVVEYLIEHPKNAQISFEFVTEDGFELGKWVKRQLNLYEEGRLRNSQIKSLENIGLIPKKEKKKR